jgi:hypothetical protein
VVTGTRSVELTRRTEAPVFDFVPLPPVVTPGAPHGEPTEIGRGVSLIVKHKFTPCV